MLMFIFTFIMSNQIITHSQREAYMDLVKNSGGSGVPSEADAKKLKSRKECNKFTYSHVSRPISHIVLSH